MTAASAGIVAIKSGAESHGSSWDGGLRCADPHYKKNNDPTQS